MGDRRRMMGLKDRPLTNGVYIEATNGKLFTSDKWTGSLTANSIVVIDPSCSFRIALKDIATFDRYLPLGSSDTEDVGKYLTAISSQSTARTDMQAKTNTENILKVKPSTSYLVGACANFTFPDGKTKGLFPSAGWFEIAYKYKTYVSDAINACDGVALYYDNQGRMYWTSTYYGWLYNSSVNYSRAHFWVFDWKNKDIGLGCIDDGYPLARAFAEYN